MSYFIIIRGPAGVGKSTISRLLAKNLKAEVIHFDKVMRELNLNYIKGDKWIPLHKFLKADEKIIPELKERLRKGKKIIVEGNFYHKEHIKDITRNLNFPHFVLTLKAPLRECLRRDKTRKELGGQAVKEVFKLVSAFDFGITINTTGKTLVRIIKEIIIHLPKQHNNL